MSDRQLPHEPSDAGRKVSEEQALLIGVLAEALGQVDEETGVGIGAEDSVDFYLCELLAGAGPTQETKPTEEAPCELPDELSEALVRGLLADDRLRSTLVDVSLAESDARGQDVRPLAAALREAAVHAYVSETSRGETSRGEKGVDDADADAMDADDMDADDMDADDMDGALLADVVAAERDVASLEHLSDERLTDSVRSAALAAFDASSHATSADPEQEMAAGLPAGVHSLQAARERSKQARSAVSEPLHARPLAPLLGRRGWSAAAAIFVALLSAGILLSGGGEQAEAGLQLSSLARVDRAGAMRMSQVQPRYFAELGRVFTPAEDELLALGFGPASRLIVGAGDAVRVTGVEDARSFGAGLQQAGLDAEGGASALMRLESGEVLVVTEKRPVALLVDGVGLLVLLDGAAHVAMDPSGGPAVALPAHAEARYYAQDGSVRKLLGPATGLLSAAGPQRFGEAARSLFDELKFFGGPLPRDLQETPVSARTCGVQTSTLAGCIVRKGRQDLQVIARSEEPGKPSDGDSMTVRFTWQPKPWLADAHLVRVHMRAPQGSRVALPTAGAPRGSERVVSEAAALASEPGISVVELELAAGWYEQLAGGPLVIELRIPRTAAGAEPSKGVRPSRAKPIAWFDGLTLVLLGGSHTATPGNAPRPVAESDDSSSEAGSK